MRRAPRISMSRKVDRTGLHHVGLWQFPHEAEWGVLYIGR
jgi:hypothetical protein